MPRHQDSAVQITDTSVSIRDRHTIDSAMPIHDLHIRVVGQHDFDKNLVSTLFDARYLAVDSLDLGAITCLFGLLPLPDELGYLPAGFLNLATPPACGWIYATYCQEEPTAAARLLAFSAGFGGTICPGPCEGTNCSTDCGLLEYANSYVGFASDGSEPCELATVGPCLPVSAVPGSWGSIKATYR